MKTNETSRELAIKWWNNLQPHQRLEFRVNYLGSTTAHETDFGIEEIWRKENPIASLPDELINTNFDGIEEEHDWDWFDKEVENLRKPNQKQFKEFNPEIFKTYIDKFSDKDKVKALKVILDDIKDLSVATRNSHINDKCYSAIVLFSEGKEILEYKTREW